MAHSFTFDPLQLDAIKQPSEVAANATTSSVCEYILQISGHNVCSGKTVDTGTPEYEIKTCITLIS